MSRVTIILEDADEETFRVAVDYGPGFNPASNAHQHGNLLMRYLDENCQKREGQDALPVGSEGSAVAEEEHRAA